MNLAGLGFHPVRFNGRNQTIDNIAKHNTTSLLLNTLLFFPSGAVYPIQAFPWWLRGIARVDPFSFAVHGFKTLLLKEAGLAAIVPDMIYLSLFAIITLSIATPLFKRTL